MADLIKLLSEKFSEFNIEIKEALGEITMTVPAESLLIICKKCRDLKAFQFDMLIDVCGVDYLHYGVSEWKTEETTLTGYSRAADRGHQEKEIKWDKPRFAVVYHLLSVALNQRLRIRTFLNDDSPVVDSVIDLWPAANWFEREAFDLYGIMFTGHPDLRRILTDYGFIGHPFRKDFPLSGNVEMRFDAKAGRCVYEPVSIQPRTLVPKTIRVDTRYLSTEGDADG